MKLLITGGGGFIGSAVIRAAELAGHEWETYDARDGCDIRDADRVLKAVIAEDADAVIHLAGLLGTHELFDHVGEAVDVNINGSLNVLEACRQTGARYVGIAMPDVFPSIYTATKIGAMRLARAYQSEGVHVAHVVAFNAYGPGQAVGPGHPQKIVPHFAVECANDRPIPIWGDGSQTVDLVHVDDLGELLVETAEWVETFPTPPGRDLLRDGGTGVAVSVLDVARGVAAALDRPATVRFLPMRRGERPSNVVAEVPQCPVRDQGLAETVRWYAERHTGENDPWR